MGSWDMRTIMLSHLLSATACTVVMIWLWRQGRRRYEGTAHLALCCVLYLLGMLLLDLRGDIPDWASLTLANTLIIAAVLLLRLGLGLFVGKPGALRPAALLLAAFILIYTFFLYARPSLTARAVCFSLAMAVGMAGSAWLLLRVVQPPMRAYTRSVGLVCLAYVLGSLLRVAIVLLNPSPQADLFAQSNPEALTVMGNQVLFILLTFAIMLMFSERLLGDLRAQEALAAQARQRESVTLLAGGVAHHLNNLLVPILGYAELMRDDLPADDPRQADLGEIINASKRSRDIILQLLSFSRRQMLDLRSLDLSALITEMLRSPGHALREGIALQLQLAEGLGRVQGDAEEIKQALWNLIENAQEAMPQGGTLRLETAEATLAKGRLIGGERARAGRYIVSTVRDSGTGIPPEVMAHLFEPFLTTKALGQGVGLGLATVYGIVKQHRGYIEVESAAGAGSAFRLYWPRE